MVVGRGSVTTYLTYLLKSFVVGMVLAAGMATSAAAQSQSVVRPSQVHPAATLVMPFDATDNHTTFAVVSRIGASIGNGAGLRTHWVFYSADCAHLADLSITLTEKDTVVVDAHRVQSETQFPGVPENVPLGPCGRPERASAASSSSPCSRRRRRRRGSSSARG